MPRRAGHDSARQSGSRPSSGRRVLAAVLCLLTALPLAADARAVRLSSPDGDLVVEIALNDGGGLEYQLFHQGAPVIRPSPLGVLLGRTAFVDDLEIVASAGPKTIRDRYELWTGKQRFARYRASEMSLVLENNDGRRLQVTLRLSNDGFAYRYEFAAPPGGPEIVRSELSGVHFLPETRAWLQPKAEAQSGWKNTNPSYEEDYFQGIPVGTPSPTESGWIFPALFRFQESWILLAESGVDGRYPGSNLEQHSEDGLYRLRFPQDAEVITDGARLPEFDGSFHTPWRLLVVGDLQTLMQSTLGTDLAEGLAIADTSFVEPGIAAWSWGIEKDDSVVYAVQERYVDYAARMKWPYVLADVNWDQNIGYEKIALLAKYAATRNVGLFLWYNSSGDWNETDYSPKSRLLTDAARRAEFRRLADMGIRGVKIDFFPGDGASVMQYYHDILRDAAAFHLMVNFHGTTLPRGLHRTFPNLVTSEAVKGFEFITFFQDVADREATHVAMLPFTRNLFDPMDFTPTVLGEIPAIERRTSNAFQLALPVLLLSGVQHVVATPEQMHAMPEFVRAYLRGLPGRWDESRYIDGYPGQYVAIARRAGNRWYVAGINAGELRDLEIDLSFTGARHGTLITDGDGPGALRKQTIHAVRQSLELYDGAGFVITFDTQ